MATTEETKIPLRILVDKEKERVIFAEANSYFADILFSFLTLPMGTIVRLLGQHSNTQPLTIGSLSTLYEGMANLNQNYFWTEQCRDMLLNPRNSSAAQCCKLKLNIHDAEPTKYFICENRDCTQKGSTYLSLYNTTRCNCGMLMTREIGLHNSNDNNNLDEESDDMGGVFAIESTTFIICDDLRVMPNLPSSSLELLNDLGIRDMRFLEEINLDIGFKEILDLLKLSLFSRTPLTDLFLGKEPIISDIVKSNIGVSAQHQKGNSKKMTLKVLVQRSNNKALFAQAEEDFIDFLFSFLAIPLGSVVTLLSKNSSLGCMENLHKSISNLSVGRCLKSQALKDMLHHPRLAPKYQSKNLIFPVLESRTNLYYYTTKTSDQYSGYLTSSKGYNYYRVNFIDPKVKGGFVRGPTSFTVTDDLVVTPMSSISTISFLNQLKIQFSDVEEHVVTIGMEQALNILKASINSASALTGGLTSILKKVKQEN